MIPAVTCDALHRNGASVRQLQPLFPKIVFLVEYSHYMKRMVKALRNAVAKADTAVRLCAASPWLTEFIAHSPIVLDSLLDARSLYAPPERAELFAELARRAEHLQPPADTEPAMDLLRHYQKEITLRVAAADLVEALPLVKVSDRLTWLAEAIVSQALAFAWAEMRAQYGAPLKGDGTAAGLAVIAYGKFGGIELGYGSDLDLVFLHDCDQLDADSAGGPRSINNGTYLARLAQRLINWLATQTPAGRAYEVDMELRPNGRSGLLVSSVASFEGYQQAEAWTWEHQALTRARWVAGSEDIGQSFARIRRDVLMRPRDADKLRQEIVRLVSEAEGRVERLLVDEGVYVQQGQALASIARGDAEMLREKARVRAGNATQVGTVTAANAGDEEAQGCFVLRENRSALKGEHGRGGVDVGGHGVAFDGGHAALFLEFHRRIEAAG